MDEKTCADYSVAAINRLKGKEKNLYYLVMEKAEGVKDAHQDTHVVAVVDDTQTLDNKVGWKITKIINKVDKS